MVAVRVRDVRVVIAAAPRYLVSHPNRRKPGRPDPAPDRLDHHPLGHDTLGVPARARRPIVRFGALQVQLVGQQRCAPPCPRGRRPGRDAALHLPRGPAAAAPASRRTIRATRPAPARPRGRCRVAASRPRPPTAESRAGAHAADHYAWALKCTERTIDPAGRGGGNTQVSWPKWVVVTIWCWVRSLGSTMRGWLSRWRGAAAITYCTSRRPTGHGHHRGSPQLADVRRATSIPSFIARLA